MPRTGIMLCYPLEEARLAKWLAADGYCIAQPKFDGDRGRSLLRDPFELMSSEENDRKFSLPHIAEELQFFKSAFHSYGIYELDGEFYSHDLTHEDIHSVCSRTTNLHIDHLKVKLHIFDHIVPAVPQVKRLNEISKFFYDHQPDHLELVPSYKCTSIEQVLFTFQWFVDNNYEGIILRRPNEPYHRKRFTGMMKYKPKRTDTYMIVDVKEEISIDGVPKNRVGAVVLTDPEGTIFSVSAGLNDKDREHYWLIRDTLPGHMCVVKYQAQTKYGVPKFATDLEIQI